MKSAIVILMKLSGRFITRSEVGVWKLSWRIDSDKNFVQFNQSNEKQEAGADRSG